MIFKATEESNGDGESRNVQLYNEKIIPGTVFCLDAPDAFLEKRVMNLPESEVSGTHNTEEVCEKAKRAHVNDDFNLPNYVSTHVAVAVSESVVRSAPKMCIHTRMHPYKNVLRPAFIQSANSAGAHTKTTGIQTNQHRREHSDELL